MSGWISNLKGYNNILTHYHEKSCCHEKMAEKYEGAAKCDYVTAFFEETGVSSFTVLPQVSPTFT